MMPVISGHVPKMAILVQLQKRTSNIRYNSSDSFRNHNSRMELLCNFLKARRKLKVKSNFKKRH